MLLVQLGAFAAAAPCEPADIVVQGVVVEESCHADASLEAVCGELLALPDVTCPSLSEVLESSGWPDADLYGEPLPITDVLSCPDDLGNEWLVVSAYFREAGNMTRTRYAVFDSSGTLVAIRDVLQELTWSRVLAFDFCCSGARTDDVVYGEYPSLDFRAAESLDPEDLGLSSEPEEAPAQQRDRPETEPGCGCAVGPQGGGFWLAPLLALVCASSLRRRLRPSRERPDVEHGAAGPDFLSAHLDLDAQRGRRPAACRHRARRV